VPTLDIVCEIICLNGRPSYSRAMFLHRRRSLVSHLHFRIFIFEMILAPENGSTRSLTQLKTISDYVVPVYTKW
jgi:hypothetical protein